jgi:hypothetical protein
MLRKRIDQYFAAEGSHEPVVVDIPKGNYAPVFRKRPASPQPVTVASAPAVKHEFPWKMWLPAALAVIFAAATVFFFLRTRELQRANTNMLASGATVKQFWSQIFRPTASADIVLDDADLGFFQEVTAHSVTLSEYFDRSYLRSLKQDAAAAKLDGNFAESLVLRRQSSYADAALLWKLAQTAGALRGDAKIHFARDYSFRELKADNVILLGNSRSNPWIEPFESHLALRWIFDDSLGVYYPVDANDAPAERGKFHVTAQNAGPHEGYATVSLLPNLSGTGKVLIISGTGGAAISAALEFLSDEASVSQLRSHLPPGKSSDFPYFEALLKVRSRSGTPKDTMIVVCRAPRP